MSGMRMPEVMQPDVREARSAHPPLERLRDCLRVQRPTVRVAEHEVVVSLVVRGLEVALKRPGDLIGKRNRTRRPA